MITALLPTIIGLCVLALLKFDVHIRKHWDGYYLVWKNIRQDLISGEYYEIYLSKKIWSYEQYD